jgi:hypothetical protein
MGTGNKRLPTGDDRSITMPLKPILPSLCLTALLLNAAGCSTLGSNSVRSSTIRSSEIGSGGSQGDQDGLERHSPAVEVASRVVESRETAEIKPAELSHRDDAASSSLHNSLHPDPSTGSNASTFAAQPASRRPTESGRLNATNRPLDSRFEPLSLTR